MQKNKKENQPSQEVQTHQVEDKPKPTDSPSDPQPSVPVPPLCDTDGLWELVTKIPPSKGKRRALLWIGNLRDDITEETLTAYLSTRVDQLGLKEFTIHNCKLFIKLGKVRARITVNAADAPTVTGPTFWPRPTYARPWVFEQNPRRSQGNDKNPRGNSKDDSNTQQGHPTSNLASEGSLATTTTSDGPNWEPPGGSGTGEAMDSGTDIVPDDSETRNGNTGEQTQLPMQPPSLKRLPGRC
eukprot:scpid95973/ scgid22415/ 